MAPPLNFSCSAPTRPANSERSRKTTDPAILEHRHRDTLGRTKKASGTRNFRFDDADDPGVISMPRPWEARLATGQIQHVAVEPLRAATMTLAPCWAECLDRADVLSRSLAAVAVYDEHFLARPPGGG
jgi:hypothetical protein